MIDVDREAEKNPRPALRWWIVAGVVAAAVFLGLGFALGARFGDGVGSSPAIDIARESGFALPLDQQPAFTDGEITREELEAAGERLTVCVESAGVTGWTLTLRDDGFSSSYLSDDGWMVERCRIQHFNATQFVWQVQNRER